MAQTISNAAPPKEVDIIVVGGGAAGCVLAGRLARADPTLQVMILENGQNNKDLSTSIMPAMYISHLAPTSTTGDFWQSKENKDIGGRAAIVPSGGCLGGGSSINFLMYTRASASDYDDWDTEGWSFNDILPLARKMETNHLPGQNPKVHGKEGPLHVSYGGHQSELGKQFIKATEESNYEIPYTDDLQDFKTGHGITPWAKWINPKTGRRCDTAHCYVHPVVETQTNLHVLCEQKVIRVLFDESTPPRAVGVEYCANPLAQVPLNPEQPPTVGKIETVKAKKYVVVSAGAMATPGVLERSGVGAKDVLEKAGVDVVVDLPGVGAEYQDHQLALGIYVMDENADTHDEYLRGNPEVHAKVGPEWTSTGKGLIASNAIDAGMKLRPTEAEIDAMGNEFRTEVWDKLFKDAPDKPVMFGGIVSTFLGDHALLPPKLKYAMLGCYLMYPLSRGSIHITSSDPFAAPDFDSAFLRHPMDLPPQVWAWKVVREITRRMPSYRGELAPLAPKFKEGSEARCLTPEEAVELLKQEKIEDIKYSKEDDEAIEEWVRQNVGTTWHSMATCPMKAKAEGGVVDARLNVHGTEGLKLADLSICPKNMGSNTYSVALTVGEKAAMILAEDLGITGV
ncbi:GMC oxidoreductase-domain-containing protein [Leucosporidium creatinivorum]|uniref:GMC oxidoreductase-domain-containing protein n=1 Tax=Leucosporidium creatinivorum TaxID=106004 RepID=A0A1Y2FVT3_9BASI|nr:GMC oxidoreductase-domain-containing protein [Leucosporidium creatinivorum]